MIKSEKYITQAIKDILILLVNQIKDLLPSARIMLYGSYSNNTYTKDSDIDIAVFVDNDSQIKDIYRKVLALCSKFTVDIQPQVFIKEELDFPIGIVEEVAENGIDITDIQGVLFK